MHGTGHHAVGAGLAGSAILLERGHFILGMAKINASGGSVLWLESTGLNKLLVLVDLPVAAATTRSRLGGAARRPRLDRGVVALLVVRARHHVATRGRSALGGGLAAGAALAEELELTLLRDEARRAEALDRLQARSVLLLGDDATLLGLHQVLLL